MREIDEIKELETWLLSSNPTPAAVQELDLTAFEHVIMNLEFRGSLFLGCELSDATAGHIVRTGGLVILNNRDFLFQVHRAKLYSPKELFDGFDGQAEDGYKHTFDYKIYEKYVSHGMENPSSIAVSLMRRLHDHSITEALNDIIDGRKVVAIMGGHSTERQDEFYLKVAKISRILTQKGFLMVSGGGPGAMEATHIGAYFACRPLEELVAAVDEIKIRPVNAESGKEYADKDWLNRALNIMEKYPIPKGKEGESMSIGVPTWLYGHEPPAPFATHIAKYFANSVREDGLLTIAKYGVIFAPGSAGTTQEIFQDATQNHYAPYNKYDIPRYVSPMILFGKKWWTEKRPLWDFIKKVSEGRPYGELLSLTDNESEIIETIVNYNPENYRFPVINS